MPNVKVLNMQGAAVGEIALADDVFGVEAHVSACLLYTSRASAWNTSWA